MLQRRAALPRISFIHIKIGVSGVTWNPRVVDWGGGRKQSRESPGLGRRQTDTHVLPLHRPARESPQPTVITKTETGRGPPPATLFNFPSQEGFGRSGAPGFQTSLGKASGDVGRVAGSCR